MAANISNVVFGTQQQRCLQALAPAPSIHAMGKKTVRHVTEADKAAAARLKEIWLSIPKDQRPTQHELGLRAGKGWNQSLVSQYMNGVAAMNAKAVLFFARELGVSPQAIRDDLPELQAGAEHTQSLQDIKMGLLAIVDWLSDSIPGAADGLSVRLVQWLDADPRSRQFAALLLQAASPPERPASDRAEPNRRK